MLGLMLVIWAKSLLMLSLQWTCKASYHQSQRALKSLTALERHAF